MGFSRNLIGKGNLGAGAVGESSDQTGRSVGSQCGVYGYGGAAVKSGGGVRGVVERLIDPAWFNLSGAHVTVSTVGIATGMRAFTERLPTCRLALSLHSARQSVRERIMPQARMYPLSTLKEALEQAVTRGTVMIEYLLLKDLTDRPEDLSALVDFVGNLPVHINLIPFNSFMGSN